MTAPRVINVSGGSDSLGAQLFLSRCRDVAGRRWWIFIVPFLFVGSYGAYRAESEQATYKSSGTLTVSDQSYLGALTQARATNATFETVGSRSSRQFNGLMSTDEFALLVATKAGLGSSIKSGSLTLVGLRSTVVAVATGDSLVQIVAVENDPNSALTVAQSAIDTYRSWVLDHEVSASGTAEKFFDGQLSGYQDAITTANNALTDYLVRHPAPKDKTEARDIAEQLEIQTLNDHLTRAQKRYDDTVDKREDARLATVQSNTDINQRIEVVDAPAAPLGPEGSLKKKATTVVLFGVIGALLSVCVVALAALVDRSIHREDDLRGVGLIVLGIVPFERARTGSRRPSHQIAPVVANNVMREAGRAARARERRKPE
jgi:hypothetical protein